MDLIKSFLLNSARLKINNEKTDILPIPLEKPKLMNIKYNATTRNWLILFRCFNNNYLYICH